MEAEKTVFLVDDDPAVRKALLAALEASDYKSEGFGSAKDFLDQFDPTKVGCLILDMRMPEMSGLELQARLLSLNAALPIIFITGHGDSQEAQKALEAGALAFMQKPFDLSQMLDKVDEAFSIADLPT